MSETMRQSELFAGSSWKTIYRAFTNINFASYDYHTIKNAMVDYIRTNFPEDYNDWIESSEFVFILELIAYLGEQLAFRFDLNVRENFIETAEKKESVLRLARMLSYSPKRNYPASGLLKIEQISTTESLVDSNDRDLSNRTITWNDPANPDWFEQWIVILNAAMPTINPFGRPFKSGTILGKRTEIYNINNYPLVRPVIDFSAIIDGRAASFEIVNVDFDDGVYFFEKSPNSADVFNLIYSNDSLGNNSAGTGFFFYFKQGQLTYEDYFLENAVENRVIDVDTTGINEVDVWLHDITETGQFVKEWTKVPTLFGENIIYNSVANTVRDIYTVITKDDEKIALRFADGRFGTVPRGYFRLWYRTSNGQSYRLRPQDIDRKIVSIDYFNSLNELHTLTLTFSLKETVTNSRPPESIEQVRERAPRVYYTQNRMVTGEDYNFFPQRSNIALKLKAINRVYSGHSRYIDLNDPTGTYQNTNIFSNDGILYQQSENNWQVVPRSLNKTTQQIVLDYIQPMLSNVEVKNYLYDKLYSQFKLSSDTTTLIPGTNSEIYWTNTFWTASESSLYNQTGIFSTAIGQGNGGVNSDYMTEGALIKFRDAGWVQIISVIGNGNEFPENDPTRKGEVSLSTNVLTNDVVVEIKPAWRTTLIQSEIASFESELEAANTFAIRYDLTDRTWKVIQGNYINLVNDFDITTSGKTSPSNQDSSWLIYIEYTPDAWKLTSRGLMYVFESEKDVRFFFVNNYKVTDVQTGRDRRDYVKILRTNHRPYSLPNNWDYNNGYSPGEYVYWRELVWKATPLNGISTQTGMQHAPDVNIAEWTELSPSSLNIDHYFKLYDTFVYADGHMEPRRVRVDFYDSQDDGLADNPESFEQIVYNNYFGGVIPDKDRFVFWEDYIDSDGYQYKRPVKASRSIPDTVDNQVLVLPTNSSSAVTIYTDYLTGGSPTISGTIGDIAVIYFNNDNPSQARIFKHSGTVWQSLNTSTEIGDWVITGGFVYFRTLFDGEQIFEKIDDVSGQFIFDWQSKKFYKCLLNTSPSSPWTYQESGYSYNVGRADIDFQWKHYAPRNQRIDPAITNIIDIYVLTTEYDTSMRNWVATGANPATIPTPPTNNDLHIALAEFDEFKMISDQIIWKPVKYKLIFGAAAPEELQVKFKVIKNSSANASDGEIKSRIISAINDYFSVNNWEFGDTFYFTSLATWIHQNMATLINSIAIVPLNEEAKFGNLFQIKAEADELFISCADVSDIIIENSFNETVLRIGK
jgi:hypothetical protein